jgi:hypothetical protein
VHVPRQKQKVREDVRDLKIDGAFGVGKAITKSKFAFQNQSTISCDEKNPPVLRELLRPFLRESSCSRKQIKIWELSAKID